ncbi:MAG: sigma 54-interacting transcriptional regulator [Myxococcota bacterium]|jgi:transcriptional regulator with GAF, ATPase, and Fis domain|nr:sigma 54-interacting transcriptional regulator [Myxococcota bacterium]
MMTHVDNMDEPVTRIISTEQAVSSLQMRRARLKVVKGPDKGLEKPLPPHGFVVGTSPTCNFMLTDTAVSQAHLELLPGQQGFRLRDLDSRNGTWARGLRVTDVLVEHKELIEVGYTTLRLIVDSGHEEFPLSNATTFGPMLGRSLSMRQVFALLERAATSDATLLLEGESGTGKDLAAETVHALSPRTEGPFVVVDCGSMQATLVESQLFGHRKGAFTGAMTDHTGAFEAADGGTVFLDEIGELDSALQPKLLRVLEKRQVQRLGENSYRPVDVRVIAATNRDLESELRAGRFRQDLFYRLSVLRVHMPALRERRDDIPELARHMAAALRPGVAPEQVLGKDVLELLGSHPWPGNVRELRNVIERMLIFPEWPEAALGRGRFDMQSPAAASSYTVSLDIPFHEARRIATEVFEKAYLEAALDAASGVVAQAARQVDLPRQTFHRLLAKHKIIRAQE